MKNRNVEMFDNYKLYRLQNGIRVVHAQTTNEVCRLCIMINVGSSDETPEEYGAAHFIEHTMFKGTKKRNALKILSRLDEVGGELNAYTTKEETVVHATFLKEYFDRAAELVCDMFFCSEFPSVEVEREREVVVSEIMQYRDNPQDRISDDFEHWILPAAEGHNILGTPETVMGMGSEQLKQFRRKHYDNSRIVFGVTGDVSYKQVERIVKHYLESVEMRASYTGKPAELSSDIITPQIKRVDCGYNQATVILGRTAPDRFSDDRMPLVMAMSMLGGSQMNSRLNIALRERNGIGYTVSAGYGPMQRVGMLNICFDADKRQVSKALRIVKHELEKMQSGISAVQAEKLKRQLRGQMGLQQADQETMLHSACKDVLIYDELKGPAYLLDLMQQVDCNRMTEVAQKYLGYDQMFGLVYY